MTDSKLKEILDKHDTVEVGYLLEDILSAMREAVEIGSIGFAEWIDANHYFVTNQDGKWKKFALDSTYYTSKQLYQEYLKSINI